MVLVADQQRPVFELPVVRGEGQELMITLRCSDCAYNPYNAGVFVYKPWGTRGYFQFEIIINVLVNSFRFSRIPMVWVYGHYK